MRNASWRVLLLRRLLYKSSQTFVLCRSRKSSNLTTNFSIVAFSLLSKPFVVALSASLVCLCLEISQDNIHECEVESLILVLVLPHNYTLHCHKNLMSIQSSISRSSIIFCGWRCLNVSF